MSQPLREWEREPAERETTNGRLASHLVRFADFHLDLESGELVRAGLPVKIAPQPARALRHLVEHAGRLVSRRELQQVVWGDGRHVDFEGGLNYCIRQIREALGDSVEAPRFVATVPRRGYRFVATVEAALAPAAALDAPQHRPRGLGGWRGWLDRLARRLRRPGAAVAPLRLALASLDAASSRAEDASVARILSDELLVRLTGATPGLEVVITPPSAPAAGGVDLRVEGSLYRAGEELTLALRLMRERDGVTLWAETYRQEAEGGWRDWSTAAGGALSRVIAALVGSPRPDERLAPRPPVE